MEPEVRKVPVRYYEIDLLRFLAALSVVLFHYTFRGYAADNYSPIPYPALSQVTRYGYLGVELFFIISGYVVLLSAQGKSVRQFFVSRVTRLYPAFWAACTLTFLVLYIWGAKAADTHMGTGLGATIPQYVYNLTMLNTFIGIRSIDAVYWTLGIEIGFYFLVSLLIGYRLLPYLDWFIAAWLGYISLDVVLPQGGQLAELFFLKWAPYFVAGMLFYQLQASPARRPLRLAMLGLSYVLCLHSAAKDVISIRESWHGAYSTAVVLSLITLFFVLFALLITRRLNLSRLAWLPFLGSLTYPLYLLHSNIAFVAWWRVGHLFNKYVLLAVSLLSMLVLSRLLHVWVEKPLSKWLSQRLAYLFERLDTTRQS